MQTPRSIYTFKDYKEYVRHWISCRPSQGRGELKRFAELIGVHSTLMSQVVNGSRDLSLEQAVELADVMHLTRGEKKYFVVLVQAAKAGSKHLREMFLAEAEELSTQGEELKNKFPSRLLDEKMQAEFYSNWTYSAVRLATDLPDMKTPQDIADVLGLPLSTVNNRLDFLMSVGLCKYVDGGFQMGPPIVYVNRKSPFVVTHHKNWRLKAFERMVDLKPTEFVFTSPVSISKEHVKEVSALLSSVVDKLKELVLSSKAEELRVLNIDWVKVEGPDRV